jgi:protein required for attachment to host cells
MPLKPIRTWVVIADAARVRVFETRGRGKGLAAVEDMAMEGELAPGRELTSDRPGRSFESVGSTRHAMEGADPRREQKRQFARRIADAVASRQAAKSFDRLVLVAPPATMGDLRAVLPDKVKAAVTAEVVADLTKTPVSELPARLEDHVRL